MVLTTRVGKKRPFWRGFVLSALTLGFYTAYWSYRAPTEVYRQYELHQEGRDDGVAWLVLGLILPVLLFAYNFAFLGNVRYVRARMGLPRGMGPWGFSGLQLAGTFLVIAGFGLGLTADPAFLDDLDAAGPEDELDPLPAEAAGPMIGGVLLGVPVIAYGYYRVQRDVNDVWDAFDARLAAVAAAAPRARDHAPARGGDAAPAAPARAWDARRLRKRVRARFRREGTGPRGGAPPT